ncbi:hypothetical protein T484DRAFT_3111495 [Baffinella frigidus]|nr:hypothetical protein T484DRAFT_3111495 [Cryptophyta sp. CCMP2293]
MAAKRRPSLDNANTTFPAKEITFTARCVLDKQKVACLQEWMGQEIVHLDGRVLDNHVLYAASRDGFSNEMFHKLCDGKAPTLTIVLLDDGRCFGGHTAGLSTLEAGWGYFEHS